VAFTLVVFAVPAAQPPAQPPTAPSGQKASDEGIPVTSAVVRQACASCHATDEKGRMSRISFRRTTPEGWQQTIRRMVLLNAVTLDPDTARQVVRELSNTLGLAPEEARPAAFEAERRVIDHHYEADKETADICTRCHSMGRVISQRRTREEWDLLMAMHRGYYPLVDTQGFVSQGGGQTQGQAESTSASTPSDGRQQPKDRAAAHLAQAFPFNTADWAAWSANMRPPRLEGTWLLVGREAGNGPIYGRMETAPRADQPDEFETKTWYVYPRTGKTANRTGQAIVYTGFQWRGRSVAASSEPGELREVMFVERDWRQMSGRWFTGGYDEIGLDVTLRLAGAEPIVAGVSPPALRIHSDTQALRIYGAGLPADLTPSAIDLGRGIQVTRVVAVTSDMATIEVRVDPDAPAGTRDLFIGRASLPRAVTLYDRIDSIRVAPQAGLARVGGVVFPKQYQQFEAHAYQRGPDGKPDTADDLDLGVVDVEWSLEEYAATFTDDDLKFVGKIDGTGLFTPAEDGPNPARRLHANNVGDVWVVATLKTDVGSGASRPLRARAHLLVTVPLYLRWEPWKVEP